MHIPLPVSPLPPLGEGDLETPEIAKTYRGDDGVRASVPASIGQPKQWADGQWMGDKWQPPVGGRRFHVVRLALKVLSQL